MSEAEQPAADSALSFDRAEFEEAPAGLACAFCRRPLQGQYWEISKRQACANCRATVQTEINSSLSSARFMGALGYGALAALAGCFGWLAVDFVISGISNRHYQIGFVAIGVGYLVGKAVRKGARGFGGPRYQVLAVLLTYAAIAMAHLPLYHSESSATPWFALIIFAFMEPFLNLPDNIIGVFIIGIGLYEAWKFTRAIPIQVLGPFSLSAKVPVAHVPVGPHAAD